MKGSSSNKGWHQRPCHRSPVAFLGGQASKKKKIDSLFQVVKHLVDAGITGVGVIAAF
jgi:hypothetical protein